ncbi:hypothetical protein AB0C38_23805 [Amycolatopsis sp. NPDC048633]|uniref:hypothetical protein n=1 Tax=Amycolatopsis sp. NPDC048633 TaxID=3157095 RepID=UPI0033DBA7F8
MSHPVRFADGTGAVRVGLLTGEQLRPLAVASMSDLLRRPVAEIRELAEAAGEPVSTAGTRLLPPLDGRTHLEERSRPRLIEIIANLRDRVEEARMNGWLGEVQGLQVSLDAATRKLVSMDRTRDRHTKSSVDLPMPTVTVRANS